MTQIDKRKKRALIQALLTIFYIAIATGIGWGFRQLSFPETNIVVVYILIVLLVARFTDGYFYGIAGSVLATAAFNYFFTSPYYTFSVNDPSYFVTFFIMTLTAVVTSALTSKVKQTALIARQNEAEASALYQLTNRLTDAADMEAITSLSVKTISEILQCNAACLCFQKSGAPDSSFLQQHQGNAQVHREVDDGENLRHRMDNLRSPYDINGEFYDWPIFGRESILGVLRIPVDTARQMTDAQTRLLHSMIESIALAMDRFISAQARIESNEEARRQRDRGNLLRAISHDLRTPLSGIMGTSEMLMAMTREDEERYQLAFGIYKDANWLHSMVENILNLTRLQEGQLVLHKQQEAVEEVVGVAVTAILKSAPDRAITVHIPSDVLMVAMDARLIEQVLVNLLNNAIYHTRQDEEVSVLVHVDAASSFAVFTVADRGIGISDKDLPHVFDMFYTTQRPGFSAHRGVGLGLAICKSIVTAHGGTILARNREEGPGAELVFTLPMEGKTDAEAR
jgi:two-component system, OmpR family, sensor histidine kinase KdpD